MSTSAFDSYAAGYDNHFTNSPIGILQRKRVYKFLKPLLSKQKKVLEINCGTGEDAVAIAPLVNYTLATDISPRMIQEGAAKKERQGIKNLEFEVLDINANDFHLANHFDILFSNFGGLNCISPENLKKFSNNISPSISSGGKLILVIMGKKCIWENLFFLKQKDSRYKRRNTVNGIPTSIGDTKFNTYYYSPADVSTYFIDHFRVNFVKPIGLFIPPSYLNSYFKNKKWILHGINVLEKIAGNISSLSNYADHFIIVLEKKPLH